jgi:hypothetical protein
VFAVAPVISNHVDASLDFCHLNVVLVRAGTEVHVPAVAVKVAPTIGTDAYGRVIVGAVKITGFPIGSVFNVTEISDRSVEERILFPSRYVARTPNL